MTITSIGSSFSYIRPEAAARETSAAAVSQESNSSAGSSAAGSAASPPQASGSARPSVADELRALLVKAQESHASPPAPRDAARAYADR